MPEELISNIHLLHTTELGAERIKANLGLKTDNVIEWCRNAIRSPGVTAEHRGKNWYIYAGECVITINAHSFTVITAHRRKS